MLKQTLGLKRAMPSVGTFYFYLLCALGVAAIGILPFSGSSNMYGMAKTTTVVKDVLDRFEQNMAFSPCASGDTTTQAQCAVENGYVFYRDDYGYRISLASDPGRTPIITFATRDSLKRLTTVRSEFDIQKFSDAFTNAAPGGLAI
jgi:hypothetical protein